MSRASGRRRTPFVRVGAGGHPARVPLRRRLQVVSRAVQGGLTRGWCRRRTAAAVGRRGSGCPRWRRGAVGVPRPSAGAPQRRLGFACTRSRRPGARLHVAREHVARHPRLLLWRAPVGSDRNGEGERSSFQTFPAAAPFLSADSCGGHRDAAVRGCLVSRGGRRARPTVTKTAFRTGGRTGVPFRCQPNGSDSRSHSRS